MKYLAIIAAIALSVSAAHADPVTVMTPKAPVSEQDAQAYVDRLEKAVKKVCYQEAAPMIGANHYLYLSCIKATREKVAKDDPTGLYAARDAARDLVLAAN